MKFTMAQLNTLVGDIEGNLRKALEAYEAAREAGSDLVIFPEQTIPGYPAKDLLNQKMFIARNEDAAAKFAEATKNGPAAVIGFAKAHNGPGKGLYNAAALCRHGVIEKIYRKMLLPTYDVFDEDRYFDSGSEVVTFELDDLIVGIVVCEDMWNDGLYWTKRLYTRDPVEESVRAGAKVVVNLSASPYTMGKRLVRRDLMSNMASRHRIALIQVNLVGANDDLIFDGVSMAVDEDGALHGQAKPFEEDLVHLDLGYDEYGKLEVDGRIEQDETDLEELRQALALGIRDYVRKCGFKKVLVGLSGGIDSAVVAVLAAEAIGAENVWGVSMPSRYSSDHSKDDARELAEALGIQYDTVSIEPLFATALESLEGKIDGSARQLTEENIQSRLRGLTLMSLSNATGALVLTTGNKSEMSVGYCTLYGDMCGGLAVIADVPKTLVYKLAQHINLIERREVIPASTLTKPPSAELRPDQKDTDSLPPYEVLDPIIRGYVEESLDESALIELGHDPAIVHRVLRMISRNEYKRRQAAPTLKVTSRAFGYGWRMPIARK